MARMKDPASLAKKWSTRASNAATDYKEGVAASGGEWQTRSAESEENYKAAVTQAAGEGRFGRGIARAGGAYYAERAAKLGGDRYGPGVQASQANWQEGSAPFLQAGREALATPRRVRGQNAGRANEMAERMRAIKLSR